MTARANSEIFSPDDDEKLKELVDFYDSADYKQKKHRQTGVQRKIHVLIKKPAFDITIGLVIMFNCVLMGFETNCRSMPPQRSPPSYCDKTFLTLSEHLMLGIFVVELFLQAFADWKHLKTLQGAFDAVIVIIGVVNSWILEPLVTDGKGSTAGRTVLLARALRLLRLTRVMRLLKVFVVFPELWIMMRSLMVAVRTIFWGFILGMLLIFVFSVIAVEAFYTAGPRWSTMPMAMQTLLQVATLDSWTSVMFPLIGQFPFSGTFFCVVFVCLVSIAMMNLIAAILTERSIQSAEDDSWMVEMKRLESLQTLKDDIAFIFDQADQDRSGEVSKTELRDLWNREPEAREKLKNFGSLKELEDLFDMMNCDLLKDSLGYELFSEGILKYNQDRPLYLAQLTLKHLEVIKRRIRKCEEHVNRNRTMQIDLAKVMPGEGVRVIAELADSFGKSKIKRTNRMAKRMDLRPEVVNLLKQQFDEADLGLDGELDFSEFSTLFPGSNEKDLRMTFHELDFDYSGKVDFEEFLTSLRHTKDEHIPADDIAKMYLMKKVLDDAERRADAGEGAMPDLNTSLSTKSPSSPTASATLPTATEEKIPKPNAMPLRDRHDGTSQTWEERVHKIIDQCIISAFEKVTMETRAMIHQEIQGQFKHTHGPQPLGLEKLMQEINQHLKVIEGQMVGLDAASAAQGSAEAFHGNLGRENKGDIVVKRLDEHWRGHEQSYAALDGKVTNLTNQIGQLHMMLERLTENFVQAPEKIPSGPLAWQDQREEPQAASQSLREEWHEAETVQEVGSLLTQVKELVDRLAAEQPHLQLNSLPGVPGVPGQELVEQGQFLEQGNHESFRNGNQFERSPTSASQRAALQLRMPPMVEVSVPLVARFQEAPSTSQQSWNAPSLQQSWGNVSGEWAPGQIAESLHLQPGAPHLQQGAPQHFQDHRHGSSNEHGYQTHYNRYAQAFHLS